MRYCVGLTGNIASGKSTAAACFQRLGIAVISADKIARDLTAPTMPALNKIEKHFGGHLITQEGELNRGKLRQIIFEHPKERLWLEGLLHPLIKQEIQREAEQSTGPYCVIEIPLLKKRSDYPYIQRILVIQAKKSLQIARVMARDNCDEKQAEAILAAQPSDLSRSRLADDIILNTGFLEAFNESITRLHKKYLALAAALPH